MLLHLAFAAFVLMPLAAQAETIPCTHRYADLKVREFFNYIQEKPDVKTGVRAIRLEEAREIRQHKLAGPNMLIRYCEGKLRLDNGAVLQTYFRLGSREDYKRDRAEDIQTCWNEEKYGSAQIIDQNLWCSLKLREFKGQSRAADARLHPRRQWCPGWQKPRGSLQ